MMFGANIAARFMDNDARSTVTRYVLQAFRDRSHEGTLPSS